MATINPKNHIRGRLHGSFGPKAEYIELDKLKRQKRKAQIEGEGRRRQSQLHFCTLIHRGMASFTQPTLKDQLAVYGRAAGGHHWSFLVLCSRRTDRNRSLAE